MHILGPIHVGLLRGAVSALKAVKDPDEVRESILGEVQPMGHLLVNGVPVCDSTWFELVKLLLRYVFLLFSRARKLAICILTDSVCFF